MAVTVDERIVAAKFDASDFEKGVNKTIKKLDELKESLNMKEATKSVKELAEKTEVSTNSMSNSLDKLTNRFTTFTGMIKQKILGGFADEVANVFLRMEQSVKGFVQSISTAQVSAGLDKYQSILTSVRVLLSSNKSLKEGQAYEAIGDLRDYVDQTSYSLTQMTDALSKMVSAGSHVDDAKKSVQGIANACADAGVNAQDAARAFYNLSQAYGKGKLNYTDYKSLELLNMTTENFKKNLLEAAVTAGTLKKLNDKADSYKIVKGKGKGKKVTLSNLSDMLRYDFVDTAAMNTLFGKNYYYSDKALEDKIIELAVKKYHLDSNKLKSTKDVQTKLTAKQYNALLKEAKNSFTDIAKQAYNAAKEARSFRDVLNTIKDVVSTGWEKSFESIFGKLEEAKNFFTDLADGALADSIYWIGEWRNGVLDVWNSIDPSSGDPIGRTALREAIFNITEAIASLVGIFEDLLPSSTEAGMDLMRLTINFKHTTREVKENIKTFRDWMNSPIFGDGRTRIEVIRETIGNLATAFSIAWKVISTVAGAVGRVLNALSPVFDGFIIMLEKLTQPISDLNDSLKKDGNPLERISTASSDLAKALEPVAPIIEDILKFLGDVGAWLINFSLDSVIANIEFFCDIFELFLELIGVKTDKVEKGQGILQGLANTFQQIKDVCSDGLNAVKDFMGSLIEDLKVLLGLTEGKENESLFARLSNFFETNEFVQNTKKWINQALIDIGDFIKSIPERIKKLGVNIYTTIHNILFEKDKTNEDGSAVLTPLGEWLANTIINIKNFILSIPDKIIEGIGTVGNWIDAVFDAILGNKEESNAVANNSKESEKKVSEQEAAFDAFLQGIIESVKEWFDDLPNKIQNGLKKVGNFFARVINAIDEFLFGKKVVKKYKVVDAEGKAKVKAVSTRVKSGFSLWLDGVIKEVQKFIDNIPEYINKAIKGAGDLVTTIISAIFGKKDGTETTNKDVQEKLEKPFQGIDISGILATIANIGREILNQIARIFTGSEDYEANANWFAGIVADGIKWIRTKAEEALKWVSEFISTLPSKIAAFFTGENKENPEQGPIGTEITEFGKTIGKFLTETLPETILGFINDAVDAIDKIWQQLYDKIISGSSSEDAQKVMEEAADADPNKQTELSGWEKFVNKLGETFTHIWEKLPIWIAEGIRAGIDALDTAMNSLTEWLKQDNIAEKMEEAAKEVKEGTSAVATGITEGANEVTNQNGEQNTENRFLEAIKGIGLSLYKIITTTIPAFITQAWNWVAGKASGVWGAITGLFDNYNQTDFSKTVSDLGEKIKNAILNLPSIIEQAFIEVKKLISGDQGIKEEDIKFSFMDQNDPLVKPVVTKLKESNKKIKEETGNPSFWSFITDIGTVLSDAFKAIGPAILSGINEALKFIGSLANIIIDALTGGKDIPTVVGEKFNDQEGGFKQTLIDLGENLKTFFIETIPKFIGAAIGILVKEAPKWISNLWEGVMGAFKNKADEESNKANNGLDGASETVEKTGEFLERFLTSVDLTMLTSTTAIVAGLLIVLKILEVLQHIIAVLHPMESYAEASEAKNSIEAVFKRALTVLIAGMALVAYAATLSPEQFEQAKVMFNMLSGLLTAIMTMYTFGSAIENVSDLAQSLQTVKKDVKGVKDVTDTLAHTKDGLDKGVGTFAKGAGVAGATAMVGSAINSVIGEVLTNLSVVGSLFTSVSENIKIGVDQLYEIKDRIETAYSVMSRAVDIVGLFPEFAKHKQDAEDASETLTGISGGLQNFVTAVSGKDVHATEIVDALDHLMSMSGKILEFTVFMNRGTTFEDFKYMLASLGSAFSLFSGNSGDFNLPEKGFISSLVSTLTELLGNDEFIGLAGLLKGTDFPTGNEAFKSAESMIIFANSLKQLAAASIGLDAQTGKDISGFIAAVGNIDFTPLTKGGDTTKIADQLSQLGVALGSFAENTKDITSENVQTAEYAINVLSHLAVSIKNAGQGFLEKAFNGESNLSTFALGIRNVGGALGDFFKAVEGIDENNKTPIKHDYKTLETASIILQDLSSAFRILGAGDDKQIHFDRVNKSIEKFGNMGEALKKFIMVFRDPSSWENGGFNESNFSFIEKVVGIFDKLSTIMSRINGTDNIRKKVQEFYEATFGGEDMHGELLNSKKTTGLFYIIKNLFEKFGSFYSDIKNNKYRFVDADISDFYTSVAKMFNAMSYMTSIGFGVGKADTFAGQYEFSIIQESYTSIVDILRYFNDNIDVITDFLDKVSTYDFAGVKVAGYFFNAMGELANAMNLFSDMSSINRGLLNLKGFDWATLGTIVQDMLDKLGLKVQTSDNKLILENIGTNIAKSIFDGIQYAFNTDDSLRPTITPILNLDPLKEQFKSEFGTDNFTGVDFSELNRRANEANTTVNFSEFDYSRIDAVTAAVNNLATNSLKGQDLANAFDGMYVRMDTDRLVGAIIGRIDDALGERYGWFARGNSVPSVTQI